MSEQAGRKPPTGLERLLWRAPIWLYRLHLGWLLGERFLLLHHIGRKSGQPRQAVLEVAAHRTEPDEYVVASGFGFKSDWYLNVKKTPDVSIQVGRKKMDVTAELLSAEQSGERMVQYARKYPRSARNLCRVLGHETDGSATRYREIGEKFVPFVAFHPR